MPENESKQTVKHAFRMAQK